MYTRDMYVLVLVAVMSSYTKADGVLPPDCLLTDVSTEVQSTLTGSN